MTPTNKDQALPDSVLPKFERDGCAGIPQVMWPWNSEWMRESDLSALLQALDPTVRARVLEPYQSEVMTRLEALAERVAVRHDDELSVARAEAERLMKERDIAVADRFDAVIGAREIEGQLLDAATEAARLRERLELAIEFVHANVGAMEAQEMRDAYLKEPDPKEPTT